MVAAVLLLSFMIFDSMRGAKNTRAADTPNNAITSRSGWYATIYCADRMPSCGVRDGYVVQIPMEVMTGTPTLTAAGVTDREKCKLYGAMVAQKVDETARVIVDCVGPARGN